MKRIRLLLCAGLLTMLMSSWARAESPQHFAFEAKFGPYIPALDKTSGLHGTTPFSDQFGDPADPYGAPPSRGLLSLGEFDYQFFHRFGVLGVGISAGYTWKNAAAFTNVGTPDKPAFCKVEADPATPNGRRYKLPSGMVANPPTPCFSGDQNVFNMVPVELLAVYRFDVLDKRYRIPLIPYIKVGFGYYFWWFGHSGSFVSQVNSVDGQGNKVAVNASGGTPGFVLHPGVAIDLSALDPAAARAIDQEIGLNRVSIFIEMHGVWMQGCCGGQNSMKLNLSDLTFTAGMGFEF